MKIIDTGDKGDKRGASFVSAFSDTEAETAAQIELGETIATEGGGGEGGEAKEVITVATVSVPPITDEAVSTSAISVQDADDDSVVLDG